MNSSEQRSAFRIAMPDGQKQATLRIQGRTFDVQLVDASSTGVAIACPLTVGLEIDDTCELLTLSGNSLLQVVRKEIFKDGILLGAVRTGDVPDGSRGILSFAFSSLSALPGTLWQSSNATLMCGLIGLVLLLGFGLSYACWHFGWLAKQQPMAAVTPPAALNENLAMQAKLQAAALRVDAPERAAPVSASDQRALKIFDHQKQLLLPDTSRRLRLSPAQESHIQRAIEAAAEAAADTSRQDFWEAIHRSERQILNVLSPSQVKAWRQLNGT
ncbi:PilZ domain-containing protein [Anatilimnocola sp. NA78]|uniref:PilZ domain-containing protein n=1 Tax=Anatilimnocola sp. NA78 TaxID=3415683 RepID=UPI003CE450EB